MSFYAGSDRIYITDTNGAISFDTNADTQHILGIYEANITKVFYELYYTEQYFTIGDLPDDCDFVICRAKCVPFNLVKRPYDKNNPEAGGMVGGTRGRGAFDRLPTKNGGAGTGDPVDWAVLVSQDGNFFQGSLPLEMGHTMIYSGGGYIASPYARRILHVYPEPAWGNKLVCMIQQSTKSGFGAVPSLQETSRAKDGTGDYDSATLYGSAAVRWEINLKVWAGKFRV